MARPLAQMGDVGEMAECRMQDGGAVRRHGKGHWIDNAPPRA